MKAIKQTLFTGWHFMRWVRLAFGIFFMVQAIQKHDTLIGVVAAFFLTTALTNTGCCGAGVCTTTTPVRKYYEGSTDKITLEETNDPVK